MKENELTIKPRDIAFIGIGVLITPIHPLLGLLIYTILMTLTLQQMFKK